MTTKNRATKKKRQGRKRNKSLISSVSLVPPLTINDGGTGTKSAVAGTEIVPLVDKDGKNPNNQGRRQRISAIEVLNKRNKLTLRQYQAAKEISDSYCRVEMLSSGGDFKERVDGSSKPDATIAFQVSAMSRFTHVMKGVPLSMRPLVEDVCFFNKPLRYSVARGEVRTLARFQLAMDKVADHMAY